jgi:NADH-quinone oxidoreductase subunit C
MLGNQEIQDKIQAQFAQATFTVDEWNMLNITIPVSEAYALVEFAKNKLAMNFLTDICGVHYPDQALQLGVVYHMHNMIENVRIRIKTFVSADAPNVPSMVPLFLTANWLERETYDFYGIIFEGHPNLRRILNVDDMVAFPLRKEYPLEDPNRRDKEDKFFGR